jgi:hypothetical protein
MEPAEYLPILIMETYMKVFGTQHPFKLGRMQYLAEMFNDQDWRERYGSL